MKKLVRLLAVVVVLLVALVVAGIFYIDTVAKAAIEVAGTRVLGVQTTVDKVSIGLTSGSAAMNGLAVANPEGCATPQFLKLESGAVAVTPASLLSNVIRVPKIEFSGMHLEFEQRVGGDSNVDAILANVKKFAGEGGGKPSGDPKSQPASEGKKFVIDELTLNNISVTARATGVPLGDKGIEIKVPKIVLKDIGSGGSDPVGLDQLTAMIVQGVMKAVMEASNGQLPDIFAQSITNGLAGLGDVFNSKMAVDLGSGLKDLGGNVGKALEDVGKGAGEAIEKGVKDATKGIGDAVDGLFKK
jgi:hypothetical protein